MSKTDNPPEHYTILEFFSVGGLNILGGLYFGLLLGSTDPLFQFFRLSLDWDSGALWSIAFLLGTAPLSIFGGLISNLIGRVFALRLVFVLAVIGAIVMGVGANLGPGSTSYWVIIAGRIICGCGVGLAMVNCPLVVSIYAPAKYQKTFGTFFQVFVTVGILLAAAMSIAIKFFLKHDYLTRDLLYIGLIILPTVGIAILSTTLPAQPSKAALADQEHAKAPRSSHATHDAAPKAEPFGSIEFASVQDAEGGDSTVAAPAPPPAARVSLATSTKTKTPFPLKAFFIGICVAAASQLSGLNAVLFFSPDVMYFIPDALLADLIFGVWNFGAAIVGIPIISRVHPRKMLFVTLLLMSISAITMGICSMRLEHFNSFGNDAAMFIALLVFVAAFEFGPGPLFFICAANIFPGEWKGRGASFTVAVQVIFTIIVPYFFKMLVESHVPQIYLWGFFSVIAFIVAFPILFMLPSTESLVVE